uniref:SAM domain-containing protein n=1 Tax=Denticeps clupeoides TaxID=299321 RepID=A0AAY4DMB5_9TELE
MSTPPGDPPGPGPEFDLKTALDWKDGIATLPGSDIRFRMTEFGTLEIVTEQDASQTQTPNSDRATPANPQRPQPPSEAEVLDKRDRKDLPPYLQLPCLDIQTHSLTGSRSVYIYRVYQTPLSITAPQQKKRPWSWSTYLEEEKGTAAPLKLFKEHQSFPQSRNGFKVGMKLEGLDPTHPSLFCVLTVAEAQGYRIRLHFDGYPECYDFWVNADSWDVKPPGWCEKMGLKLLLPKGCRDGEFNWSTYVKNCRGQLAPKHLFRSLNASVTPSGFRAGMKLEAVDRKNPSLICVATIAAAVDNRLLIHFDNWDDTYDYWCDASSPYIHPVGYCEEAELTLTTPAEYKHPRSFSWERYLEETGTQAAPARAFKQIHFDGWSDQYDYWLDADSPDLHPVGWCQKTGHPLQHPQSEADLLVPPGQGCPTPGCNGVGHIRGPRYGTHYTAVSCPYSEMNLNRDALLPDRLSGERPVTLTGAQKLRRAEPHTPSSHAQTPTPSTPEPPGNHSPPPRLDSLQQLLHDSVFGGWEPPRVQLSWEKHCKLLPEVLGLTAKRVSAWNTDEVAGFVRGLPGCREHAATFRNEQIDGEAFLLLTQSDIVKILSIKLGPALKIYNSILMLKSADEE